MSLQREKLDLGSLGFKLATGLATFSIVAMVIVILGDIVWSGAGQISLRFIFGGTSLLIMVGVGLDTVKQIESQLQQRNYEGFLR